MVYSEAKEIKLYEFFSLKSTLGKENALIHIDLFLYNYQDCLSEFVT